MLCPGLLQLHFPFLVLFVSLDALFVHFICITIWGYLLSSSSTT